MLKSMKLPLMAAALAFPMALLSGGAQAQVATYCGGAITSDGVYSSPDPTLLLIMVIAFKNRRDVPIPSVTVTVDYVPGVEPISGSPPRSFALGPGQQVTVQLGKLSFYNPSGVGPRPDRPDLRNRLLRAINVTCGSP